MQVQLRSRSEPMSVRYSHFVDMCFHLNIFSSHILDNIYCSQHRQTYQRRCVSNFIHDHGLLSCNNAPVLCDFHDYDISCISYFTTSKISQASPSIIPTCRQHHTQIIKHATAISTRSLHRRAAPTNDLKHNSIELATFSPQSNLTTQPPLKREYRVISTTPAARPLRSESLPPPTQPRDASPRQRWRGRCLCRCGLGSRFDSRLDGGSTTETVAESTAWVSRGKAGEAELEDEG